MNEKFENGNGSSPDESSGRGRISNDAIASLFQALGDPMRLKILRELPLRPSTTRSKVSVKKLSETLNMPQPTVSHHLKVLRQAGAISSCQRAAAVFYYVNVQTLKLTWKDFRDEILTRR